VSAMAVLRHGERTRGVGSAVIWTLWLVFAAGTVFTAVMPMMAVFGSQGQAFLLWSHRCTALTFTVLSLAVCFVALKKRR